jgi:bifunctional DNA-binding transcriptional regulator/antitoxin component of YhaV-PrlF toxin-antitoxin module
MTKVVSINERGTLTLPKEMRNRLGVTSATQVFAEETDEGNLLRPGATFPIEIYSEKRLREFQKHNDDTLAGLRIKKKHKR